MISNRLFRELRGILSQMYHLQHSLDEELSQSSEKAKEYILHLKQGNTSYADLLRTIIRALDNCNEQEREDQ